MNARAKSPPAPTRAERSEARLKGRARAPASGAPAEPNPANRLVSTPTRAGQPRLVGEHDELGPVAHRQLGHRPVDVGLDGSWTQVQLGCDLVVGEPLRH